MSHRACLCTFGVDIEDRNVVTVPVTIGFVERIEKERTEVEIYGKKSDKVKILFLSVAEPHFQQLQLQRTQNR